MRASSRSLGAIPEALDTCIRKRITGLLRWFRFADIFTAINIIFLPIGQQWQVKILIPHVRKMLQNLKRTALSVIQLKFPA